jgi:hypothetical protein
MPLPALPLILLAACTAPPEADRPEDRAVPLPEIVILDEPGLPYYMTDSGFAPSEAARWLRSAGFPVRHVSVRDLLAGENLVPETSPALVSVYGNTFPLPALGSLRDYHRKGGNLVCFGGTPFCHPCIPGGLEGWEEDGSAPCAAVRDVQAPPHTGTASLRLEQRDGAWFGLTCVPNGLEAGAEYRLSAWFRVARDAVHSPNTRVWLRSFDSEGRLLTQDGPAMPLPGSDWTRMEERVRTHPDAVRMDLSIQAHGGSGSVWLDDVVLAPVGTEDSPDAGPIPDPGFEQIPAQPVWTDTGHEPAFSHEQMGTGGFAWHNDADEQTVEPPGLRMGLQDLPRLAGPYCTLDPESLPEEDKVVGAVAIRRNGTVLGYPVALIVHGCSEFRGAVDVLAGGNLVPELTPEQQGDLLVRCTVHSLVLGGRITEDQARTALASHERNCPPENLSRGAVPVLEPNPCPTFYPRSPAPAHDLYVLDVRALPRADRFLACVLQGLVNRAQPRVYVHADLTGMGPDPTGFWLANLRSRGYASHDLGSVDDLVDRFAPEVGNRAVLYPESWWTDPECTANLNIVALLCSIEDLIPATATQVDRLGLEIDRDVSELWPTPADAYGWALEHLWMHCNHHVMAFQHPQHEAFFDYLVAFRIFPFVVLENSQPEMRRLFTELLRRMPANSAAMGCWGSYGETPRIAYGEHDLVAITSRWAKIFTVTQWTANLTVHSGVPVTAEELRQQTPAPPLLNPVADRVYLAFDFSDGDNLQYVQNAFYGPNWWGNPARGQVPLVWSMAPTAADLMPDILAYYYATATPNDEFICAVSGIGYCYPDIYATRYGMHRERLWNGFAALTATYMHRTDMTVVNPFRGTPDLYESLAIQNPELTGILADYGKGPDLPYTDALYTVDRERVPVFRNLVCYGGNGDAVADTVRMIREATPTVRPAFLHVFAINWFNTPAVIRDIAAELGPEYVPCTATQFVDAWKTLNSTP